MSQKYYEGLGALNLGVAGDQTQHLLWRMQNGELPDVLQPQVGTLSAIVVVMAAFFMLFFFGRLDMAAPHCLYCFRCRCLRARARRRSYCL